MIDSGAVVVLQVLPLDVNLCVLDGDQMIDSCQHVAGAATVCVGAGLIGDEMIDSCRLFAGAAV